ncbi:MAG: hypothetical protein DI596_12530, partial [Azospira oryzae]
MKVFVPLALGVVILLAVSALGVTRLAQLNGKVKDLSEVYIVAQDRLLQADRDLQQALVAERSLLAVDADSSFFAKFEKDYRENLQQARDRMQQYAKLIGDEKGQNALAQFEELLKAWQQTSAQVVELRRRSDASDRITAVTTSVYAGGPEFEAVRKVLDQEEDRLGAMVTSYRQQGREAYHSARTTLIAAAAA